ncbi:hypothetical protein J3B02_002914 [Coemansia erecta]|nr:hypothetical protein J3B02_002914 [Coemansia erecta]
MSSTTDRLVLRTASTKVIPNSSSIEITSPIALPISICGRAAYLYNVLFNGKKAVLKLAWSPTNQMPEGAVYDLLCLHNTKHIPKVFDRGLLLEDLNGYRLEYLVVENCGQNIDDYLRQLPIDQDHGSFVRPLVEQVMECLVSARSIGILHRDISSGNIAVRNGIATVIDWGYAKIIDYSIDGASEIAANWKFDPNDIEYGFNDALTGTVSYMSIGVLSLSPQRSVFDDIESLFYVILKAYSAKTQDGQEPIGFKFYDTSNFACTRATCLAAKNWFKFFGIYKPDTGLKDILEEMHKFLFVQNGVYIGVFLFEEHGYMRYIDYQSAQQFMNKKTIKIFDEAESSKESAIVSKAELDGEVVFDHVSKKRKRNLIAMN